MLKQRDTYQVVIVGGGPVGLFLGCCLQHKGISCLIIEQRKDLVAHSRSIGIHPVSLEIFRELELAECFTKKGIKIRKGVAMSENKVLGSISFEDCPPPFSFILTLPQYITEEILFKKFTSYGFGGRIIREAEFLTFDEFEDHVQVHFKHQGQSQTADAGFLVGCDGKNSRVRDEANIGFKGTIYPDTYVMGDFDDSTDFGTNAIIDLNKEGLVESFPLINNRRRWVIKTTHYKPEITQEEFAQLLKIRTGYEISAASNYMLSSFGVQKLLADTLVKNRTILAGDAAHVVSPIGGQGMNLGWIGARKLSEVLMEALHSGSTNNWRSLLQSYALIHQNTARQVARRAEIYTRLGRKTTLHWFRNAIVRLMLNTPVKNVMAKVFTMRMLSR